MIGLVVEGLAAYRLTRLVTEDEILRPAREAVVRYGERLADPLRAGLYQTERGRRSGQAIGRALVYLPTCPWCVGIYAAATLVTLRKAPGGRTIRDVLALGAIAGLVADR